MHNLGIISGETGVADGSFLPSNVSWDARYPHNKGLLEQALSDLSFISMSSPLILLYQKN